MTDAPASPWDAFQPFDVERFGEVILDRGEQERWSRAIFLGGLTYMWAQAAPIRTLIYDKLRLEQGHRVLLLGEAVAACGFLSEIEVRVGPTGSVEVVDIVDEARDRYFARQRGKHGQLATWRYDYTTDLEDCSYDAIGVLQGVQHAEDWTEAGKELLRVLRPDRPLVLAEIAFGPRFEHRVEADIHIEYVMTKLFERIGWHYREFPYHGPQDLLAAFDGLVCDPGTFEWHGIELFWGTKPTLRSASIPRG